MSNKLPPTPVGVPPGHSYWNDWYERLRNLVNNALINHNDLQNIQGGSAAERYHLTGTQQTDLTDGGDSALHFHSADRNSANFTGTNWTDLTDGGDTTLHFHASDRARATHTGTQDHNTTLSGLQGGTTGQYYHLTSAEYTGTGTGNFVRETSPTLVTPKSTTTIGVGNTTPSASGAGVSFPATQNASTDANTLDDYEEGSWTLTVTAGSGTITSYTANAAVYTKIGNLVSCTFKFTINTNGTAASNLQISLPFTGSNEDIGAFRESALTGNMGAVITSGGTGILLYYNNTYPGGTGAVISGTLTYRV